jgi:hypothetical protein
MANRARIVPAMLRATISVVYTHRAVPIKYSSPPKNLAQSLLDVAFVTQRDPAGVRPYYQPPAAVLP